MQAQLIDAGQERTFAIIFATGDDPMAGLLAFAREQQLRASHFTAIGAFSSVTLGYFQFERKTYEHIPVYEQVEVLSLVGDITLDRGEPALHAHVVIGKSDGTAHGGHLLEARVRPTLEVMLVESPTTLRRRFDPDTGLTLIDLQAGAR
ncbi:MAG TPA: PPC domain-containing DNA-binding protein [Gemmatimonadaceae bacterium]